MLNKFITIGRLCADPELKTTQGGVPVVSFTLAVDRPFAKPDGSKDTDFIAMVAFRHTAQFMSTYMQKGRMAAIEGRLQTRKWTDAEGQVRFKTEVVVEHLEPLGGKKPDGVSSNAAGPGFSAPSMSNEADWMEPVDDLDLPF